MAKKGAKELLILGALGAAAAASYLYYEKEMKVVPEGSVLQTKHESQEKSDEKPVSPPGTEMETEPEKQFEEKWEDEMKGWQLMENNLIFYWKS